MKRENKNKNENEDVPKTNLIEQLNSLKFKIDKMLNEPILKDFENLDKMLNEAILKDI